LPPLLCAAALLLDRRRRAQRSAAVQQRQALRRERAAMRVARRIDDHAGWLAAARRALQLRLAAAWRVPSENVDAATIAARVPEATDLIALFKASERAAYANIDNPSVDLAKLHTVVERHLTKEVIS